MTCGIDDSGGALRQIENDITSLSFSLPRGVQDVTGVDSAGIERLLLLADLQASIQGVFNDAAAPSAHTTFKDVSSTSVDRTLTIVHSGQTLTDEVVLTDYALDRASSGELTWTVPAQHSLTTAPAWS
jgi:hypothetical protein